jgi:predicted AAA+ superfamily ATPase
MLIERKYDDLSIYFRENKILIIYGPRQVGKTTLVKNFLQNSNYKFKYETGDNIVTKEVFMDKNLKNLLEYVEGFDVLVIDEAQKIPDIGVGLKMLVDAKVETKIIVTGSSSFELSDKIGETLTGRKITLTMYPVALNELDKKYSKHELDSKIEDFLIFGMYPEILVSKTKKEKMLLINELANSYLLKDVLAMDNIKNSKSLFNLLRLIAYQIGNQVSMNELGKQLGIDTKTVGRYLDILEKSFVLYNLTGFSKNLRKEITKKGIYYFYDVGIRNALISNFNHIDKRNDVGMLWENFLFMERLKYRKYNNIFANTYFWRTWDGQEIDLIEEREGKLFGYEFKWGKKDSFVPNAWADNYAEGEYQVINRKNYKSFVI